MRERKAGITSTITLINGSFPVVLEAVGKVAPAPATAGRREGASRT